jgi:hypothetical protein
MFSHHLSARLSAIRLAGVAAIVTAALATTLMNAAPALAAPYWCQAWQVSGQTWYASQSNGYTLLFTLRTPPGSTRFNGYARYNRGDVNLGGTPSQLIRGAVSSEGAGRVLINIVWRNGASGQYNATVTSVRRTASGALTAGLSGTTVDTTGSVRGGAAYWDALGWSSGLGTSGGRYYWPMFCPKEYVLRYPA